MKTKTFTITLIVFLIFIVGCLYQIVKLAIDKDGLQQESNGQSESISVLLDYAAMATRCDLTPKEASSYLNARHPEIDIRGTSNLVSGLAFALTFKDDRPDTLEIVGQRKVNLCRK